MYKYFDYKLWSVLLAVIFLAGCPAVPVVDNDQQPDSSDVDTATYHLVKAGETLYGIAELYGRSYQEIAAWNSLVPPYMLTKGLRLQIDGPNENVVLPPPHNDNAGIPVDPYSSSQTHTVQKGDTLYSISHQYGQTIAD
ncbi:MAG: LysM peptidoglycan-binding domain-containing protein, partial [Candidatus Marithrix sp.]|nr:LysM peptidoglycan-binding domain-containing protein [Candidatus Marithrix sp.]